MYSPESMHRLKIKNTILIYLLFYPCWIRFKGKVPDPTGSGSTTLPIIDEKAAPNGVPVSEVLVGGGAGLVGAGLPQHGTQQQNRQTIVFDNSYIILKSFKKNCVV